MSERPNLLLVISDQHNPHVTGCYGNTVVRTPNLDALADSGVRFAANYCNAPLCVPSRMSFMTGQQPHAIGCWTNSCILPSDVPTFAHALGAAGYEAVLGGRMHFIGPDQRHGFESRLVGDLGGSYFGKQHWPDLGPLPLSSAGMSAQAVDLYGPGRTTYQAYDDAVTDACRRWLRDRDRADDDRPWCLVVGYVMPHCPYICPKATYDYYLEQVRLPELPEGYEDDRHPAVQRWRRERGFGRLARQQQHGPLAAYYGMVEYLDSNIGRLLETLGETHFADTTAVGYTSDHGDLAGEHGAWTKGNFYEGSVGVPLIWSWPGHFAEGRTVSAVTSLVDLAPTLIDLAEGEPLPHAAGRSLTGSLLGDTPDVPDWPDTAFAENYMRSVDRPGRMVRRGPWKLNVHHGYDRPELFNLDEDPDEYVDRAEDPACAPVREELTALVLDGWDAEQVERTLARRGPDHKVLADWADAVRPDDPDQWSAPEGTTVFPEG